MYVTDVGYCNIGPADVPPRPYNLVYVTDVGYCDIVPPPGQSDLQSNG